MSITDKRFSFECFPPKTEKGQAKLDKTLDALNTLQPDFFSVTYGAGGSTRTNTLRTVEMAREKGIDIAPHLSFGGDDEDAMHTLLQHYKTLGVKRIVALRGDIPSGMGHARIVYANELVAFIRQHFGNHFEIEVAAYPEIHPQSDSYDSEISFFKNKLDTGADSAITQYFYNADAYFYFLEHCHKAGIEKPIYPGVMPIVNFTNLLRFSQNCGAEIPRWLTYKITSFGDDRQAIIDYGIDMVTALCEKLLAGGAPGIHFYTMNQYEPTASIVKAIQ